MSFIGEIFQGLLGAIMMVMLCSPLIVVLGVLAHAFMLQGFLQ